MTFPKRVFCYILSVIIAFVFVCPRRAKAIDPVSAGFLVVGIGNLALNAYQTWRAEHPDALEAEYPGYNPGGVISSEDAQGGHFSSNGSFDSVYTDYVSTLPGTIINGSNRWFYWTPSHSYYSIRDFENTWRVTCSHGTEFGTFPFHVSHLEENKFWLVSFIDSTFRTPFASIISNDPLPCEGYYSYIPDHVYAHVSSSNTKDGYLEYDVTGNSFYPHLYIGNKMFYRGVASFKENQYLTPSDGLIMFSFRVDGKNFASDNSSVLRDMGSATITFYDLVFLVQPSSPTFFTDSGSGSDSAVYASETRPASIIGDYGIVGDNGQVQQIESQTIVNETDNSVYNPVTNTTHTVQDWSYDYSDRSYHITTTEGDTMTITYGDENITIQEGSQVYNVYYLIDSDSSGSEDSETPVTPTPGHTHDYIDDEGQDGFWAKIGTLFGKITIAPLKIVSGFIGAILDWLIELVDLISDKFEKVVASLFDWFNVVPSLFNGFLSFFSVLFPFLPSELLSLFNWGLAVVVFTGVFRRFFRR